MIASPWFDVVMAILMAIAGYQLMESLKAGAKLALLLWKIRP